MQYLDDAVKAMDIHLTLEKVTYLEKTYTAHDIVGALDFNPTNLLP